MLRELVQAIGIPLALLLLHPAINGDFDESVQVQGHRMRFATVDLAGSHQQVKERLLELAGSIY